MCWGLQSLECLDYDCKWPQRLLRRHVRQRYSYDLVVHMKVTTCNDRNQMGNESSTLTTLKVDEG